MVESCEFEFEELFGVVGAESVEGCGDGSVGGGWAGVAELGGDLVVGGSGFAEFECFVLALSVGDDLWGLPFVGLLRHFCAVRLSECLAGGGGAIWTLGHLLVR